MDNTNGSNDGDKPLNTQEDASSQSSESSSPAPLRLAPSSKERRFSLVNGSGSGDPTEEPLAVDTPRPALTSIAVKTSDDRVEATATLALSGRVLTGTCAGPKAERTAIVASATASAIAALVDCEATIDTARIVDLDGHLMAVCVVKLADGNPEFLVGSALVRGDEEDATARSVLSALNRRLTK